MLKRLDDGAQWLKGFLERHPTIKSNARLIVGSVVTAFLLELGLDELVEPVAELIR